MDMEELLKQTELLVKNIFSSKKDKANRPYLEHLYYVSDHFFSPIEKIVALLHDTLEDSDIKVTDLEQLHYPKEVIEAVIILTKDKDIDYSSYIDKIIQSNNDLAIKVKYVDLLHNMDLGRIANPTKEDIQRVVEKYEPAIRKIDEYLEKKEG